jgi:hypothetical protein
MWSENAWLCNGLWRHYLYTMDANYLSNTAYPAMKTACNFWLSRMITVTDGTLVAPQGYSPEHGPTQDGISFDQQLIGDLFNNTVAASQILGVDSTFRSTLQSKLASLDPGMHVGDYGQLREWKYTDDDPKDDHRHQSYAMCLYPAEELFPYYQPSLAQAIEVSLDHRTDGGDGGLGFGWDHAWKMALRSRLFDGNHAYTMLQDLLKQDVASNLFDTMYSSSLFQIDANYGMMAGMSEMLMQSHAGFIQLLPALPSGWSSGSISGLVAQGNYTVGMTWSQNALRTATITSNKGGTCVLKNPQFAHAGTFTLTNNGASVSYSTNDDVITFSTTQGSTYIVNVTSASQDFFLSGLPTTLTATYGSTSPTMVISVNSLNGFSGTVSLSASRLPAGVTASFSPSSTTTTSTLTLTAGSTASNGPATVYVTATSGSLTRALAINLLVANGVMANGTYEIVSIGNYTASSGNSTAGSGLALDCPSGGGIGTVTDQQPYSNSNQQWNVTSVGGGWYEITCAANGLAVSGPNTNSGLVMQTYTGASNQQWSFTATGNGSQYIITNRATGQVINNFSASNSPGNTVGQWPNTSGAVNQQWSMLSVTPPIANGTYRLTPLSATGSSLEVSGWGTTNGSTVDIWSWVNQGNEQWTFTNTGGNTYKIEPSYDTALCLEVYAWGGSGGHVDLWADVGQANERWIPSFTGQGYIFAPQYSPSTVLEAFGTSNGSTVGIWNADGGPSQTWTVN